MIGFIGLLLLMYPSSIICQFNMTAYRQMPPLFALEDYDVCLDSSKRSSYCVVIGEIVPNTTSDLWNQIANFSADTKRHFRHDYLYFGVCLNRCKQLVRPLSSFHKNNLYSGKLKNTELTTFLDDIHTRESDNRIVNNKVINICLNYNFTKQYGLQVRTYIQYCVSNSEPSNFDYLEFIVMVIVGLLLFLNVLCSNYDRQLKKQQPHNMQGLEFYKQHLHTQRDVLLTSFSICRNYYRLSTPARSEFTNDFRFLEAYRFFATLMVVLAHVLLFVKGIPTKNTEFTEKIYHNLGTNLFINGTVIVQIFLVMSSFFLCIYFQLSMALNKPGIAEWVKLILYRYLRIAPSLAFVILLNASILPRLQDGPFWRQITEAEYVLCRETWWKNLLFINNFSYKKSCLHQTWYLGTDFQLYVILTTVLIIIARFPQIRNYILGGAVIISFLSTGMVTYFLELDGIYQETPDAYRYLFWTNSDTMYKGYTPFYMNFGGFVFGAIAALIYLKYKNEKLNLSGKKAKLNLMIWASIPLYFLLLLSGEIFYRFEFTKPSVLNAIYAGLYRNIWAMMSSSLVLLMSFKVGSILYEFSSLKMFVPLGRLSFQVFLIHSLVIRCLVGNVRQPIYSNNLGLTTYTLASIVISFFGAFFLYMFFELPLTTIINSTIKESHKTTKVILPTQLGLANKKTDEATTA